MFQNRQFQQTALILATVTGQVGCLTVLIIAVAYAIGAFIDHFLGLDKSIFTALAIVGSLPITLYVIIRVSMATVAKTQELTAANTTEEKTKA